VAAALALFRLSNRRLAELGWMRAARLYSIGMALSFGALAVFSDADQRTARALVEQALVSASWLVAGLSMMSATRDLEARDVDDGISALAACRGLDANARARMRSASLGLRIAIGVALPAICVVLIASPRAGLVWSVGASSFALAYASVLGALLATLSHFFARFLPNAARLALLGCVLGPELLRASAFPSLPSLPSAFGWAIEQGTQLGSTLR
jgi:VIT1/CCC1 family predicted Fe2+/Mn2+ transporter